MGNDSPTKSKIDLIFRVVLNVCGPLGLGATLLGWVKPLIGLLFMGVGFAYVAWELRTYTRTFVRGRPKMSLFIFSICGAVIGAGCWLAIWKQETKQISSGAAPASPSKSESSAPISTRPTPSSPMRSSQETISLSEEAKLQIAQKLAQKYKELHPEAKGNSQPMVNWINKKLKQQKMDFYISLKPQKSRGIVVEGGSNNVIENNVVEGFDEGIAIHNSPGTTAKGNKVTGPKQPQ